MQAFLSRYKQGPRPLVRGRCPTRTLRTLTAKVALAAGLLAATPTFATIISGAIAGGSTRGAFVKLTTPLANPQGAANSVGSDNFDSPNLFGVDESQNIVLSAPLNVESAGGGGTSLSIGTTVASHCTYFDAATANPNSHLIGTVNVDADIVALIWGTTHLTASDFSPKPV